MNEHLYKTNLQKMESVSLLHSRLGNKFLENNIVKCCIHDVETSVPEIYPMAVLMSDLLVIRREDTCDAACI